MTTSLREDKLFNQIMGELNVLETLGYEPTEEELGSSATVIFNYAKTFAQQEADRQKLEMLDWLDKKAFHSTANPKGQHVKNLIVHERNAILGIEDDELLKSELQGESDE